MSSKKNIGSRKKQKIDDNSHPVLITISSLPTLYSMGLFSMDWFLEELAQRLNDKERVLVLRLNRSIFEHARPIFYRHFDPQLQRALQKHLAFEEFDAIESLFKSHEQVLDPNVTFSIDGRKKFQNISEAELAYLVLEREPCVCDKSVRAQWPHRDRPWDISNCGNEKLLFYDVPLVVMCARNDRADLVKLLLNHKRMDITKLGEMWKLEILNWSVCSAHLDIFKRFILTVKSTMLSFVVASTIVQNRVEFAQELSSPLIWKQPSYGWDFAVFELLARLDRFDIFMILFCPYLKRKLGIGSLDWLVLKIKPRGWKWIKCVLEGLTTSMNLIGNMTFSMGEDALDDFLQLIKINRHNSPVAERWLVFLNGIAGRFVELKTLMNECEITQDLIHDILRELTFREEDRPSALFPACLQLLFAHLDSSIPLPSKTIVTPFTRCIDLNDMECFQMLWTHPMFQMNDEQLLEVACSTTTSEYGSVFLDFMMNSTISLNKLDPSKKVGIKGRQIGESLWLNSLVHSTGDENSDDLRQKFQIKCTQSLLDTALEGKPCVDGVNYLLNNREFSKIWNANHSRLAVLSAFTYLDRALFLRLIKKTPKIDYNANRNQAVRVLLEAKLEQTDSEQLAELDFLLKSILPKLEVKNEEERVELASIAKRREWFHYQALLEKVPISMES